MGLIQIEGMEFFAYHGCFSEEQVIGNKFIVDIDFEVETSKAEITDDLSETINYQTVYNLIKFEIEKKSYLLEHIAKRIVDSIISKFNQIEFLTVRVSKINPPLGGKIEKVSFTKTFRKNT
jgi:dihydroneopterin aldolase